MLHFIDRKKELAFLEKLYSKKGFKLLVLYGRRRVGKTELVKQFIKDKKGYYLLCVDENLPENIKAFKRLFYEITGKDYFLKIQTKSIFDLFSYLVQEVKNKRIVLVIDEFPYLLHLNKGLLSSFQKIADELLAKTNIFLIILGSSLAVMENDVLGYRSPLYGRKLSYWKVMPFDFRAVFSEIKDINRAIEEYFVFGGVPYYFSFFNKKRKLTENIKETFLIKGINLYDEPFVLLRQEFRESRVYRIILKYLSQGYKSLGKLSSASSLDRNNLMRYLASLEETNIIRHILPLGMKRKGIYEIKDPLFRFWFKFIYPHRDKLELGNISFIQEEIETGLNQFFGLSFEYLIEELLNSGFFEEFKYLNSVHKWWHKDKEIDIVALNKEKRQILFAECKWQNNVNAERLLLELKEKAQYLDWNKNNRNETYAIFAKSFKKKFKQKNTYLFDLKDIERRLKSI